MWWHAALTAIVALVVVWLLLVAALWLGRPAGGRLTEAVRLLPDVLRLVTRLARDREVPLGPRLALWLLVAYLASPIDLVPDFLPVIGYADDAIAIVLVLRLVARRTGHERLARHWPGTPEALAALERLVGAPGTADG